MGAFRDLSGIKFGKLTVLNLDHKQKRENKQTIMWWKCKCDCGNNIIRTSAYLHNRSITPSCGCHHTTHIKQLSEAKKEKYPYLIELRKRLAKIKERIYNPKSISYHNYGERGITICKEWKNDSMNFYKWAMSTGFSPNLQIDRINVNGDYCPENCRWVDRKTQSRNMRTNVVIEYDGQKHCLSEWAEILNINYKKLWAQCKRNNKDYKSIIEKHYKPTT